MRKLAKPSEIWALPSSRQDREIGARYAERTLPWTFNRMMLNTGTAGQKERALNIAKGIVAQEMLRRAFTDRGLSFDIQRKSHRADDLFDFQVPAAGTTLALDIKSFHHYSNYSGDSRKPLSAEFIAENRAYSGPDWRSFIPMLVPHTQIRQSKEAYCFAVASSIDPRKSISAGRDDHWLCAFPFGPQLAFLSSRQLCQGREAAGKGIFVRCDFVSGGGLFPEGDVTLTIVGEWQGEMSYQSVTLGGARASAVAGPFSIIDSFKIEKESLESLGEGSIEISCDRNDFADPVRNTKRENVNQPPAEPLRLHKSDFGNLLLPADYTLYVLGWILKPEFMTQCRKYSGWIWPKDSVNLFENQPWNQITEKDEDSITKAGFADCIQRHPSRVNAGWMKTTGHGSGACCYVFPNIYGRGGVNETNLYVLPQDLNIMDELL